MLPAFSKGIVILAFATWCANAASCPNCKDAVTPGSASSNGTSITSQATGYYYSILCMVSLPFVLGGGICLALIIERRRSAAGEAMIA